MPLSFTVGGARGTFEPQVAAEVADLLDQGFRRGGRMGRIDLGPLWRTGRLGLGRASA